MSTIHQQQLIQQQIIQQQQIQQQTQSGVPVQTIPANPGTIYQISSQPQTQQQLTAQQMQALRQQQQVYQQQIPVSQQSVTVPASYQQLSQTTPGMASATVFQPQVIQQNNTVGGQFQASVPFTGQHQQLSTTIYPSQQQQQQQATLIQQQQRASVSMTVAMNAPQPGSVLIAPSRSQTSVQASPSNPTAAPGLVHSLPQQAPNIGLLSGSTKIPSPQQQVNPPPHTLSGSQDPRFVTHT